MIIMFNNKANVVSKIIKAAIITSVISFLFYFNGNSRANNIDRFMQELKDKDSSIRLKAAYALGTIKDPRAIEPLIAALKDNKSDVREAATLSLGEIKDTRAVKPLIIALKDKNFGVRKGAAWALGEIRDNLAIEPLISAMANGDYFDRKEASHALVMIGPPAVTPMIAALKNGDSKLRKEIAKTLTKMNDPRIEPIFISLKDNLDVVAGAYEFFIRKGESQTEAILVNSLDKYGDFAMVQDFLNSDNIRLEEAARRFAKTHGYKINVTLMKLGGPKWGSGR